MNTFGQPPEDLNYSIPLEPMTLNVIGESKFNLKTLLTDLVDNHPTKLTRDQRQDHHRLSGCRINSSANPDIPLTAYSMEVIFAP